MMLAEQLQEAKKRKASPIKNDGDDHNSKHMMKKNSKKDIWGPELEVQLEEIHVNLELPAANRWGH